MSVDFVFVPHSDAHSSYAVSSLFFFDPVFARRQLAAAEEAGFRTVLIDDAAGALANLDIVASVARWNKALDIAVTHWIDVTSPLIAASDIAALDRHTGGRLALRIIGSSAEGPGARGSLVAWQKTDEYLTLLKRLWSNDLPIDYEGRFYSLAGSVVPDKGPQGASLPIRIAGYSGKAVEVAGRHASVFELPAVPYSDTVAIIDRVRNAASKFGRAEKISFSRWVHMQDEYLSSDAAALSRLAEAGVSEFMVSGLHDAGAIERFGERIIKALGPEQIQTPHPAFAALMARGARS